VTTAPNRRSSAPASVLTAALTLGLLTASWGCGPSPVVDHLEVRTSGANKEAFRWTLEDSQARGKHQIFVAIENDPAKLMGLDAGARTYRAALSLRLEGPEREPVEAMLALPISEMRPVRQSADGRTSFIAPKVSGEALPNGMFRTEPVWVLSFDAAPGEWTLEASLMAPYNTDRRGLQVIRGLHIETRSRADGASRLTGWTLASLDSEDSQAP
jgi:hypothetical protein